MKGRHALRQALDAAGLLDIAREARDVAGSAPWLRDNARFWLHGAGDGLPVPPLRLVRSSTGTSSLRWYFDGGVLAAESITGILAAHGVDLQRLRSLLDFGCGCGRVIRHWAGLPGSIHGCDYNRQSVRWCRRHLTFAEFAVNELRPPLPYEDGRFDLVYALSVFTHLPEPLLFEWLRDLRRVLSIDGWLIVSVHGEAYVHELSRDQQREFRDGRLVVKGADAVGTNRCGVYFSEAYVRRHFSDGFRLVDFLPRGAKGNPAQDLVLLQKTS